MDRSEQFRSFVDARYPRWSGPRRCSPARARPARTCSRRRCSGRTSAGRGCAMSVRLRRMYVRQWSVSSSRTGDGAGPVRYRPSRRRWAPSEPRGPLLPATWRRPGWPCGRPCAAAGGPAGRDRAAVLRRPQRSPDRDRARRRRRDRQVTDLPRYGGAALERPADRRGAGDLGPRTTRRAVETGSGLGRRPAMTDLHTLLAAGAEDGGTAYPPGSTSTNGRNARRAADGPAMPPSAASRRAWSRSVVRARSAAGCRAWSGSTVGRGPSRSGS